MCLSILKKLQTPPVRPGSRGVRRSPAGRGGSGGRQPPRKRPISISLYLSTYIYMCLSLSLCIYIYIYMYIYNCIIYNAFVHIYIYIYNCWLHEGVGVETNEKVPIYTYTLVLISPAPAVRYQKFPRSIPVI